MNVQACLKYDLLSCPGVLVDVKNDEDVTNMWEELEEVSGCSSTPHRLHIFLDKLSAKGHTMSGHEPGQHEIEGFTSRTPRCVESNVRCWKQYSHTCDKRCSCSLCCVPGCKRLVHLWDSRACASRLGLTV